MEILLILVIVLQLVTVFKLGRNSLTLRYLAEREIERIEKSGEKESAAKLWERVKK